MWMFKKLKKKVIQKVEIALARKMAKKTGSIIVNGMRKIANEHENKKKKWYDFYIKYIIWGGECV